MFGYESDIDRADVLYTSLLQPRRQPPPRRGREGDRRRPVNRGEPPR
jgi:hypothetical protein